MELDPDDVFRDDDEEDPDSEFYQGRDASKELVVYVIDASPKMFTTTCPPNGEDEKEKSHFHAAVSCVAQALKTQIINRSYDEVAICFFNTREKKNLQDLNGVYVYNVSEREDIDRPTARLIKEFDCIEDKFIKDIGSQYGISSDSRNNSLYNVLWVAQGLLRKGSAKTADKRILLFTNEDNPFARLKGVTKLDMIRTTLQRAKDAQDLGISIELLPLSRHHEEFNVALFYGELLGLEDDDLSKFLPSAGERIEDMQDQLRKRMLKKRIVRRVIFIIANGISIELNTYALIRPTFLGTITWLDSVTNVPLQTERSFLCADTGSLVQEPAKRFHCYKNETIQFSVEELSEIKKMGNGHLRLLGFKPMECLEDYHNLRPSTFVYPSDEEVFGSTRIFIALYRSMLRLKRFAVAFNGSSAHPQLVALVAQDEIPTPSGQLEPPGMHMIYLPYANDIKLSDELDTDMDSVPQATEDQISKATAMHSVPQATEDQISKATALVKRIDLEDFSVCQFANPALQRHYAVLQALALDEDEMPEIKDETAPDEEGMARPGVVKALEEFKNSIYGESYDDETESYSDGKVCGASRKRKASAENAAAESAQYDWGELADSGKLKDFTVAELKYYLTAHNLPVGGKKEALITRILNHMAK